jgi:AraC-like DNA-binding protein
MGIEMKREWQSNDAGEDTGWTPVLPSEAKTRLWFRDEFWWFRKRRGGPVREINALLRWSRYDITEIADALGVGERTFHRLVKEDLGLSAGYWLRWLRAVEFRKRIVCGPSAKTLARDFGFKHYSDFSTEFKRWYGVCPREFVKRFWNIERRKLK